MLKLKNLFSSDKQQTRVPSSIDPPPSPPPPVFSLIGPVNSFSIPLDMPPSPLGYSFPSDALPYQPGFGLYGSFGQYPRKTVTTSQEPIRS